MSNIDAAFSDVAINHNGSIDWPQLPERWQQHGHDLLRLHKVLHEALQRVYLPVRVSDTEWVFIEQNFFRISGIGQEAEHAFAQLNQCFQNHVSESFAQGHFRYFCNFIYRYVDIYADMASNQLDENYQTYRYLVESLKQVLNEVAKLMLRIATIMVNFHDYLRSINYVPKQAIQLDLSCRLSEAPSMLLFTAEVERRRVALDIMNQRPRSSGQCSRFGLGLLAALIGLSFFDD